MSIKTIMSFVFQFFILILTYFGCQYFLSVDTESTGFINTALIVILFSWLATAWLTHKFKPQYYQRKWSYVMAPFLKAIFFNLLFVFFFSFLFLELFYKNGFLYKIVLVYAIIELVIYSIINLINGRIKPEGQAEVTQIKQYLQEDLKIIDIHLEHEEINTNNILFKEENTHEPDPLNPYIDRNNKSDIRIIRFDKEISTIERPCSICILEIRINDLNEINKSLRSIYESMLPGGYLFAFYKDLDDFQNEYLMKGSRSERFLRTIFYYFYYRAFPKIPYLNFLYKLISGGRNKVISKTEIWGRLFYCGFEVEKQISVDGISYLKARKTKTLSENPKPSFYPIVTLNRVSLYGQIIKIHKIRSMYPYSEFLQKKVFEEGSLTANGKFGNDFRITKFGKFFRKYWIDEIPQFIDWFRGKIKFIGIRAMSQHFFSLYPKEYKDLYLKVKPGIISPIFDEKTAGFEDIVKIEQEYLEHYLRNPVKTDFRYFFLTIKHMFKGVRSN